MAGNSKIIFIHGRSSKAPRTQEQNRRQLASGRSTRPTEPYRKPSAREPEGRVVDVHASSLRKMGYRNLAHWLEDEKNVYIGRNLKGMVPNATQPEKWGNPYKLGKYTIEECLRLFEEYARKKLMEDILELDGKILGCWCHPAACHGDVLVKLCEERLQKQRSELCSAGAQRRLVESRADTPGACQSPSEARSAEASRVVNISWNNLKTLGYRDLAHWLEDEKHVYIGRNLKQKVPAATQSEKWGNPYKISEYPCKEERLRLYEEYARAYLMEDLIELDGKILGCWCHPEACHGDILVKLCEEKFGR